MLRILLKLYSLMESVGGESTVRQLLQATSAHAHHNILEQGRSDPIM
jgi:hypothetical protein